MIFRGKINCPSTSASGGYHKPHHPLIFENIIFINAKVLMEFHIFQTNSSPETTIMVSSSPQLSPDLSLSSRIAIHERLNEFTGRNQATDSASSHLSRYPRSPRRIPIAGFLHSHIAECFVGCVECCLLLLRRYLSGWITTSQLFPQFWEVRKKGRRRPCGPVLGERGCVRLGVGAALAALGAAGSGGA